MNTSLDNLSTEKLLALITQQQDHSVQLQERIKIPENEITRLKKLNPKPDIKPNTKPSDFACGVTQSQLLEFLWDIGVSISSGELSNLITKGHESFQQKRESLENLYESIQ
ncbi:hypothetical protein [Endozoicomonas sp. SCSIO W0465]|uniref:hypothetical protein n=1 Tax=Endozoicomonas sp. SCSIO W0465 TaxID=2918516 RepID=UPI0020762E50|nr:hypothetical protein [Endozoicomonas sp. SCSIO W0465]USE36167.1 hypothetical protein MJO57_29685 [Endozoicomonas sp. SCSIO W0465]